MSRSFKESIIIGGMLTSPVFGITIRTYERSVRDRLSSRLSHSRRKFDMGLKDVRVEFGGKSW